MTTYGTVSLNEALAKVPDAAKALFAADPRIQAVGVSGFDGTAQLRAVRNRRAIVPLAARVAFVSDVDGIPVSYVDVAHDVSAQLKVPMSGPGSPGVASLLDEQQKHRPLACGLQIENYDDDDRQGEIQKGYIIVGTLGCFVRLSAGGIALISNNHVVAGENRGSKGKDRICQPSGDPTADPSVHIATLTDFVSLSASAPNARPGLGAGVTFNEVDAGVAALVDGIQYRQDYLTQRRTIPGPSGTATPRTGDKVFKVGRTTGLQFGTVTSVGNIVGPILYDPGQVWFQNSFTIEGDNGTMFSDHGDSGSAIVKVATGEVVGLLYAGNGQETYACPISVILSKLNCTLA